MHNNQKRSQPYNLPAKVKRKTNNSEWTTQNLENTTP